MSSHLVYALVGGLLFSIGTYGLIVRPHMIHKIISANFMGSGVFLVLIGLGNRTPSGVPDPVPQAMVLTGIVVTVALTALSLAIAKRHFSLTGRGDISEHREERVR
ncbi:MAG: sodium:proton antiporter [Coriobacteriia bacterium]